MEIICHMMTSVDGRGDTEAFTPVATDLKDVYVQTALKLGAQGFIFGHRALARQYPELVTQAEPMAGVKTTHVTAFKGECEGKRLCVVLDTTGRLHYKANTLPTGEHIVVILGSHVTRAYQQELEALGIGYIVRTPSTLAEETASALQQVQTHFGADKLLLAGGATTIGSFMHMQLVKQLSVLIAPAVDGRSGVGQVIGFSDSHSENPMQGQCLELAGVEKLAGGVIWARYDVMPV